MFKGEVIKRTAKGFHSTAMPEHMIGSTGSKIISVNSLKKKGFYKASVKIWGRNGYKIKRNSDMFPKYYSKSMVIATMYAAWNKNNGKPTGTKRIGGVKIRYYIYQGIWLRGHPVL